MARKADTYRSVRRTVARKSKLIWRMLPRAVDPKGCMVVQLPKGHVQA